MSLTALGVVIVVDVAGKGMAVIALQLTSP